MFYIYLCSTQKHLNASDTDANFLTTEIVLTSQANGDHGDHIYFHLLTYQRI